ncbi:MAG: NAD-dependent epimerase/dehydratase family protein, partial [Gemmatimonadota bacterium]
MKVAVTGGSGSIGTAVIEELRRIRTNMDVTAMDLAWPNGTVEGIDCFRGSVLDVDDLSRLLRGADVVVHLAAMLGVERTEEQRIRCLNVNVEGTRCVLDGCVKEGTGKIIFASSSEVYGDIATREGERISEESPLNPKSVYAVSKLAGEEYVKAYARQYGVDYTILRFFNVYGPGQNAEFVIPKFVERAKNGDSIEVYGSGEQVRAFCHVYDAARAVVMALTHPGASGATLNIGNDREPISIRRLARTVLEM